MKNIILIFFFIHIFKLNAQLIEKKKLDLLTSVSFIYEKDQKTLKEQFLFLKNIDFYKIKYLSDSLVISGIIIRPKISEVLPVILYTKGGNNKTFINAFRYTELFNLAYYANNGYCIFSTNYRGYNSEPLDEFGGKDVNDIFNLLKVIDSEPNVDTTKIALFGLSRGGMMSFLALKSDSLRRFKCLINMGGMSNLFLTKRNRPIMEKNVYNQLIPNYKKNKRKELIKRSAVFWVNKLPKIPYLIIHGAEDERISVKNSFQIQRKLTFNNYNSELHIINGGNHSLYNKLEIVRPLVLNWLDKNFIN